MPHSPVESLVQFTSSGLFCLPCSLCLFVCGCDFFRSTLRVNMQQKKSSMWYILKLRYALITVLFIPHIFDEVWWYGVSIDYIRELHMHVNFKQNYWFDLFWVYCGLIAACAASEQSLFLLWNRLSSYHCQQTTFTLSSWCPAPFLANVVERADGYWGLMRTGAFPADHGCL